MSERINFGTLQEVIQPPNLIENQITSFREFLQLDKPASQRGNVGLEAVFREVFPIESYDGRCTLEYLNYSLAESRLSELECLREGVTFSISLYVKLRLREEDQIKDEEIYMGELPAVTERGSFIINGAERVIVSQLHRSPGICFGLFLTAEHGSKSNSTKTICSTSTSTVVVAAASSSLRPCCVRWVIAPTARFSSCSMK